MTQAEFFEVTGEIEKFFEKELKIEQSRIWFEELKEIKKERYRQISRECYRTLKFMPKLVDIIEINKNLPKPKQEIDATIYECNVCNGTGIVMYYRKEPNLSDNAYQYGARCDCRNGLRYRNIPSISELGLVR